MLPSIATSTYASFFAPTRAACCAKQGSTLLNGPGRYSQLCFLPWHAQSRSCRDPWVPWWAHILIPALQQVFLNARRYFDARKRKTVRYLPSAAGERWVDVWVTNTAGTQLAGADVTGRAGKNRNRDGCERLWPCCPYWPIPCLQPTDTICPHQHLT